MKYLHVLTIELKVCFEVNQDIHTSSIILRVFNVQEAVTLMGGDVMSKIFADISSVRTLTIGYRKQTDDVR